MAIYSEKSSTKLTRREAVENRLQLMRVGSIATIRGYLVFRRDENKWIVGEDEISIHGPGLEYFEASRIIL